MIMVSSFTPEHGNCGRGKDTVMSEPLFPREGVGQETWILRPISICKMKSSLKNKHMEAKALQTICVTIFIARVIVTIIQAVPAVQS